MYKEIWLGALLGISLNVSANNLWKECFDINSYDYRYNETVISLKENFKEIVWNIIICKESNNKWKKYNDIKVLLTEIWEKDKILYNKLKSYIDNYQLSNEDDWKWNLIEKIEILNLNYAITLDDNIKIIKKLLEISWIEDFRDNNNYETLLGIVENITRIIYNTSLGIGNSLELDFLTIDKIRIIEILLDIGIKIEDNNINRNAYVALENENYKQILYNIEKTNKEIDNDLIGNIVSDIENRIENKEDFSYLFSILIDYKNNSDNIPKDINIRMLDIISIARTDEFWRYDKFFM